MLQVNNNIIYEYELTNNWLSDVVNPISGMFHSPDQDDGLTLKTNTRTLLWQENNHYDSLGKGQNGNACALIMELLGKLFIVTC